MLLDLLFHGLLPLTAPVGLSYILTFPYLSPRFASQLTSTFCTNQLNFISLDLYIIDPVYHSLSSAVDVFRCRLRQLLRACASRSLTGQPTFARSQIIFQMTPNSCLRVLFRL